MDAGQRISCGNRVSSSAKNAAFKKSRHLDEAKTAGTTRQRSPGDERRDKCGKVLEC